MGNADDRWRYYHLQQTAVRERHHRDQGKVMVCGCVAGTKVWVEVFGQGSYGKKALDMKCVKQFFVVALFAVTLFGKGSGKGDSQSARADALEGEWIVSSAQVGTTEVPEKQINGA